MSLTSRHCQYVTSLIHHGKGIKFSYSKNITRLHGKRQIYEDDLEYVLEKYIKKTYVIVKRPKKSTKLVYMQKCLKTAAVA
jgi:hypothetical protein